MQPSVNYRKQASKQGVYKRNEGRVIKISHREYRDDGTNEEKKKKKKKKKKERRKNGIIFTFRLFIQIFDSN